MSAWKYKEEAPKELLIAVPATPLDFQRNNVTHAAWRMKIEGKTDEALWQFVTALYGASMPHVEKGPADMLTWDEIRYIVNIVEVAARAVA